MFTVLAVIGDSRQRQNICTSLEDDGYRCYPADSGEKALFLLDCFHVDILVVQRVLPGYDGCALTRQLREHGYTHPILLLTEGEGLDEKRDSFLSGGDDCMVKPGEMAELLLRVGALLRRAQEASGHRLTIGEITVDFDTLTVETPQGDVLLPKKEMCVLFKLLSTPSRTFTRQQLVEELWGFAAQVDVRTVDVHIKRLREKFRERPEFKLITVRGIGYRAKIAGQPSGAREKVAGRHRGAY